LGYLAKEIGAVVFIQWTQSGNNLSGSAQVEALSGSPPNQSVSTNTISVSGQLEGSTITLSFNGGTKVRIPRVTGHPFRLKGLYR
jgi:hypothetical protein